jgi:hypothetical protein
MARMNGNRYRVLGYVVWQAGRWYLRRRLPSARKLAVGGLALAGTLTAAVAVAKRLTD